MHLIVHNQCLYRAVQRNSEYLVVIFNISILIVFNSIRRTSRSKDMYFRVNNFTYFFHSLKTSLRKIG